MRLYQRAKILEFIDEEESMKTKAMIAAVAYHEYLSVKLEELVDSFIWPLERQIAG